MWKKGEDFKVSPYFNTKELSCHCSFDTCVEQRISMDLMNRLNGVRVDIKSPIIITSAYRCSRHQESLRNMGANTVVAKKSTHETGDAVDAVPSNRDMTKFEEVCSKYFDSIGLAKNFLHLDTRTGKRRWNY
jgi:uncharacterized protein YcbK (DUF882 family)